MAEPYVGARIPRSEDLKLVTGRGRYVDDLSFPNMLNAAFVRAEYAHALIRGIDTREAKAVPGVHAVITLSDLGEPYVNKPMDQPYPSPAIQREITSYPLAKDEVCYVGQPIALVIAETRHLAEDAVDLVQVDYEPLPAVVDCVQSAKNDGPPAHAGLPDNTAAQLAVGFGDINDAFTAAPHVFRTDFRQHRGGCHSVECRGVVAIDDPDHQGLTLYTSTQSPYLVRSLVARYLEEDESRLRVIAPNVGGGFGPKAGVYPEEVMIPLAARILGRPIKWIEDRREHFTATNQAGDQAWSLEIAARGDGKVLGVRGNVISDCGAYVNYGLLLPMSSLITLPGPYAIQALDVKLELVFTNTTTNSPVRGAGRPNGIYAMERVIETVARELELDSTDVRALNFVGADQFPYSPGHSMPNGTPITYDSGDFHACLQKALDLAGYKDFRSRQDDARRQGRYIGIGVSSCIEDTGMGPFEGATVRVQPNGRVQVQTGTASQGQSHETVFSQLVADDLGVRPEDVLFESGDTGAFPLGVGTVASRIAVAAGTAIHGAALEVREKALRLGAAILQKPVEELELQEGHVRVKSALDERISLGDLARRLAPFNASLLPQGFEPGLEATSYQGTKGPPTASGSNVAEVEVDIDTGGVVMLKYSVAHDCGRMLNPMVVDGQIIGGVVHGIGNALFERMHYDENGQPLSTNYGEYLLPLASEMPPIQIVHQETPSPYNPLGLKGAGEGGTIPAAAAVIAAIEDALRPFGVVIDSYPIDPQTICELIDQHGARVQS